MMQRKIHQSGRCSFIVNIKEMSYEVRGRYIAGKALLLKIFSLRSLFYINWDQKINLAITTIKIK